MKTGAMNMKQIMKRMVIGLLLIIPFWAEAQQDAMFSQYYFNPLIVNPGYAGSRDMLSGVGILRKQWVGIEDAPQTQTATIHGPIRNNRVGLGLQLFNDRIGPTRQTGVITSYAFKIPFEKGTLSLGLQASLLQYHVDWDKVDIFVLSDGAFGANVDSRIIPDANFGAYYYSNKMYAGAAVTHLIETKIGLADYGAVDEARIFRHYFLTGGYVFALNDDIDLKPSVLFKYVSGAPMDLDLNASFLFYKRLWTGVGLRTSKKSGLGKLDNQLIGVIEYQINKNIRLGYSFDLMLNELSDYTSGSHEIMIGYDFELYRTKMLTPRYF